ncbi:hypothetical protein [Streptomyces flaveolus]|uniref:hypothetical protein n=1 Tax=Streptomyces flaveolus TaxID=67297 RepID=UPI003805507D
MSSAPSVGPLSGLVVADFSRVLAGPYATMLLAILTEAGLPCGPINTVAGGVQLAEDLGLEPVGLAGPGPLGGRDGPGFGGPGAVVG